MSGHTEEKKDDITNIANKTSKGIRKVEKVTRPKPIAMAYCSKINAVIFTLVSKKVVVSKFNCSA